jgi:hypothetical protein
MKSKSETSQYHCGYYNGMNIQTTENIFIMESYCHVLSDDRRGLDCEWIYWTLTHTTRNYKHLQLHR